MIKYDSDIGDKIVASVKDAGNTIKSEIASKIAADYSALTGVGLFTSQISTITNAANEIAGSFESFSAVVEENKSSWAEITDESKEETKEFAEEVEATTTSSTTTSGGSNGVSYPRSSGGSSSGGSSGGNNNTNTQSPIEKVDKGKKIKVDDIKNFLTKIDPTVLPVLLQKINKSSNGQDMYELLTDKTKSNIITTILKKILGDTTDEQISSDLDTEAIQKIILDMVNTKGVDITTEEGKSAVQKTILEKLNTQVDESKWNQILYGDNTVKVEALDGTWIVAKTKYDTQSYVDYISKNGVKQNSNVSEWGDSCLAFAEAHSYDLYNGTQTSGASAAGYSRSTSFKTYLNDSKEETLATVYEEIMNGRPVVLQVNGNKQGTSRHYVTVVGFKEGVVSGATLQESDLLIIDSWDGKLERMDTSSSRFMTNGKQCGKNYTGYYLRVFKS